MIRKERAPPRTDRDFRAGFCGTIWIESAEWIFFTVTVYPLPILIAFIGGDEDGRTRFLQRAKGFHDVDRAHHIRHVRLYRLLEGRTYDRLSCKVKHEVRLCGF